MSIQVRCLQPADPESNNQSLQFFLQDNPNERFTYSSTIEENLRGLLDVDTTGASKSNHS